MGLERINPFSTPKTLAHILRTNGDFPRALARFLERGIDISEMNAAVYESIRLGRWDALQALAQHCKENNKKAGMAVNEAVKSKDPQGLKILLAAGFNPEIEINKHDYHFHGLEDCSSVPILTAVKLDDKYKVKLLVDAGADPLKLPSTLLTQAANNNSLAMVQFLFELLPEYLKLERDFFGAASAQEDLEIFKYILGLPGKRLSKIFDSLGEICRVGSDKAVELILDRIERSTNRETAVLEFARNSYEAAVRYNRGDIVHTLDARQVAIPDKELLMEYAIERNLFEMVEFLHSRGADLQHQDGKFLVMSNQRSSSEILAYLLDQQDFDKELLQNQLKYALKHSHSDCARKLLNHGAGVSLLDSSDITKALSSNTLDLASRLICLGVNIPTSFVSESFHSVPRNWREDLHGGASRYNSSFLPLARAIAKTDGQADPRQYLTKLCCGNGQPLKSDALPKGLNWYEQPFIQTAIYAAAMGSVLWPEAPASARSAFIELINADIERVESTKGLSWKKYVKSLEENMQNISEFHDVIREFTETITLPLLLPSPLIQGSMTEKELQGHMVKARQLAVFLICKGKATSDFGTLNYRWHRPSNSMPAEFRPYKHMGSWPRLFHPQHFENGISVRALTNPEELKEEGHALSHCVGYGGYTTACLEGKAHILSFMRNDRHLATAEVNTNRRNKGEKFNTPDGKTWYCAQLQGKGNFPASSEVRQAYLELVTKIKKNKVELYPDKELKRDFDFASANITAKAVGYDPLRAAEFIPRILNHYNTRIVFKKNSGRDITLLDEEALRVIFTRLNALYAH